MGTHPLEEKVDVKNPKQKSEHVESKKIPLYEHQRPHKLDGTVAMAVLLRRIYEKTHIDANLKGEARQAKVIFAADDATELVKELILIASLDKENWNEVRNELAHALRGIGHLESESHGPEKLRLAKALNDLENLVDPKTFAAAKKAIPSGDELPALDDKERLEMAAQAVIAACRQAAMFRDLKPGDDMAQARQLMVQMRLHYDTATDAISTISDRRLLARLNSDVMLATKGMDGALQFMKSTNHKLPWDRAFAEGFDAEMRFLNLIGLKDTVLPGGRPYSGTIDPTKAIQDIDNIASGKGTDDKWSEKEFESPQQAVAGIGVVMDEIYHRQSRAIKNATSDIAEPRLPKETSMLDVLLEILIKTALASAAAGIGAKISSAVTGKLMKALTSKAAKSSMFKAAPKAGGGDYFGARDAIAQDAISSGAAAVTWRAEAAKDGFKEFFKQGGYKAIMSILGSGSVPKSNSTNALHVFSQHSEGVLDKARLEGKLAYIHLAPALGQAEPGALWELYQTLLGHLDDAYTIQYSHAMEEWQNFKARMHHGLADDYSPKDNHAFHERDLQSKEDKAKGKPAPKDDRKATSDAKVGDGRDEQGALLIEAWINTDDFVGAVDGNPHVTSMRLPDAEDATLKHFRGENKSLGDVHMNKHFKLKFLMYMNDFTVDIGVGADHGLLGTTMGKRDEAVMRVVAAGDRVTNSNWLIALNGEDPKYSRFSRSSIEKQLEKYIKVIQKSQQMRDLKR